MSKVYIGRVTMGADNSYPESVKLYSREQIATPGDHWQFISTTNITQAGEPGPYFVYKVNIHGSEVSLRNAFRFLHDHEFSICYDAGRQVHEVDNFIVLVGLILMDNVRNETTADEVFCTTPSGPTLK